eukprot:482222_1
MNRNLLTCCLIGIFLFSNLSAMKLKRPKCLTMKIKPLQDRTASDVDCSQATLSLDPFGDVTQGSTVPLSWTADPRCFSSVSLTLLRRNKDRKGKGPLIIATNISKSETFEWTVPFVPVRPGYRIRLESAGRVQVVTSRAFAVTTGCADSPGGICRDEEVCRSKDCNGQRCMFDKRNVPKCKCGGDYLNTGKDCRKEFVVFRMQIRSDISSVRNGSAINGDFKDKFIQSVAIATNTDRRAKRFRLLNAYACDSEVQCVTGGGSVLDLQVRGRWMRRTRRRQPKRTSLTTASGLAREVLRLVSDRSSEWYRQSLTQNIERTFPLQIAVGQAKITEVPKVSGAHTFSFTNLLQSLTWWQLLLAGASVLLIIGSCMSLCVYNRYLRKTRKFIEENTRPPDTEFSQKGRAAGTFDMNTGESVVLERPIGKDEID